MNTILSYSFLFIIVIFISCNNDRKIISSNEKIHYSKTHNSIILIKDTVIFLDLKKQNNKISYINVYNNNNYSTITHTDNYNLIHHIDSNYIYQYTDTIPKEGPNSINYIYDFCYINNNNFWVSDIITSNLFKINLKTKTLKKLNINTYEKNSGNYKIGWPDIYPTLYYDNVNNAIIGYCYPDVHRSNFMYYSYLYCYDIKKDSISFLFGKWPQKFKNGINYSFLQQPEFVVVNNKTYVSFGTEHTIQEYNNSTGEMVCLHSYKSKFLNKKIQWNTSYDEEQSQKMYNLFVTEGYYVNFTFDKYNNVFYRLVKHPQNLYNVENKINKTYGGKWSIIIFDKNMNQIGETLMPEKKYKYFYYFIDKHGLHIAHAKQNDENKIYFDRFVLTEKK